jgi:hypothetical protein
MEYLVSNFNSGPHAMVHTYANVNAFLGEGMEYSVSNFNLEPHIMVHTYANANASLGERMEYPVSDFNPTPYVMVQTYANANASLGEGMEYFNTTPYVTVLIYTFSPTGFLGLANVTIKKGMGFRL